MPRPRRRARGVASAGAGAERSELRRRRDALAEEVTELHWDLGGLAYEMAIRDHFRLDVLVRRAAILQERDAELAEVERLLRMEEEASPGRVPACAAPHSRGAVYCWQCGTTLMERLPSVGGRRRQDARRWSTCPRELPSCGARARAGDGLAAARLGGVARVPTARSRRCASCGSPLAADQRYCLTCGERAGRAAPQLARAACARRADAWPERGRAERGSRRGRAGAARRRAATAAPGPAQSAAGARRELRRLRRADRRRCRLARRQHARRRRRRAAAGVMAPPHSAGGSGERRDGAVANAAEGSSEAPPNPEAEPTPAASHDAASAPRADDELHLERGRRLRAGEAGVLRRTPPRPPATKLPPIKHVFVIVLSDEPYAAVFGPESTAHYLPRTLEQQGRAAACATTPSPTSSSRTRSRCSAARARRRRRPRTARPTPTIAPGDRRPPEQVLGDGCVYPASDADAARPARRPST